MAKRTAHAQLTKDGGLSEDDGFSVGSQIGGAQKATAAQMAVRRLAKPRGGRRPLTPGQGRPLPQPSTSGIASGTHQSNPFGSLNGNSTNQISQSFPPFQAGSNSSFAAPNSSGFSFSAGQGKQVINPFLKHNPTDNCGFNGNIFHVPGVQRADTYLRDQEGEETPQFTAHPSFPHENSILPTILTTQPDPPHAKHASEPPQKSEDSRREASPQFVTHSPFPHENLVPPPNLTTQPDTSRAKHASEKQRKSTDSKQEAILHEKSFPPPVKTTQPDTSYPKHASEPHQKSKDSKQEAMSGFTQPPNNPFSFATPQHPTSLFPPNPNQQQSAGVFHNQSSISNQMQQPSNPFHVAMREFPGLTNVTSQQQFGQNPMPLSQNQSMQVNSNPNSGSSQGLFGRISKPDPIFPPHISPSIQQTSNSGKRKAESALDDCDDFTEEEKVQLIVGKRLKNFDSCMRRQLHVHRTAIETLKNLKKYYRDRVRAIHRAQAGTIERPGSSKKQKSMHEHHDDEGMYEHHGEHVMQQHDHRSMYEQHRGDQFMQQQQEYQPIHEQQRGDQFAQQQHEYQPIHEQPGGDQTIQQQHEYQTMHEQPGGDQSIQQQHEYQTIHEQQRGDQFAQQQHEFQPIDQTIQQQHEYQTMHEQQRGDQFAQQQHEYQPIHEQQHEYQTMHEHRGNDIIYEHYGDRTHSEDVRIESAQPDSSTMPLPSNSSNVPTFQPMNSGGNAAMDSSIPSPSVPPNSSSMPLPSDSSNVPTFQPVSSGGNAAMDSSIPSLSVPPNSSTMPLPSESSSTPASQPVNLGDSAATGSSTTSSLVQPNKVPIQPPKFAGAGTDFMAQFRDAAKKNAEAAMKKRKQEEYDPEEETEETWEQKVQAELARTRKRVEEASKSKTTRVVNGKLEWVDTRKSESPAPETSNHESPPRVASVLDNPEEQPTGQDNIFGHIAPSPVPSDEDKGSGTSEKPMIDEGDIAPDDGGSKISDKFLQFLGKEGDEAPKDDGGEIGDIFAEFEAPKDNGSKSRKRRRGEAQDESAKDHGSKHRKRRVREAQDEVPNDHGSKNRKRRRGEAQDTSSNNYGSKYRKRYKPDAEFEGPKRDSSGRKIGSTTRPEEDRGEDFWDPKFTRAEGSIDTVKEIGYWKGIGPPESPVNSDSETDHEDASQITDPFKPKIGLFKTDKKDKDGKPYAGPPKEDSSDEEPERYTHDPDAKVPQPQSDSSQQMEVHTQKISDAVLAASPYAKYSKINPFSTLDSSKNIFENKKSIRDLPPQPIRPLGMSDEDWDIERLSNMGISKEPIANAIGASDDFLERMSESNKKFFENIPRQGVRQREVTDADMKTFEAFDMKIFKDRNTAADSFKTGSFPPEDPINFKKRKHIPDLPTEDPLPTADDLPDYDDLVEETMKQPDDNLLDYDGLIEDAKRQADWEDADREAADREDSGQEESEQDDSEQDHTDREDSDREDSDQEDADQEDADQEIDLITINQNHQNGDRAVKVRKYDETKKSHRTLGAGSVVIRRSCMTGKFGFRMYKNGSRDIVRYTIPPNSPCQKLSDFVIRIPIGIRQRSLKYYTLDFRTPEDCKDVAEALGIRVQAVR